MSKSRFDAFNHFLRRSRRYIIIGWFIALAISLIFIPSFFSSVSYNITSGFGGPSNTESQKAANLLSAQFPGSNNASTSSILVVFQTSGQQQAYSNAVKNAVLGLNNTIASDKDIANYTGMNSVYDTETGLLNSSLPALIVQGSDLQGNISKINSGLYGLQGNLSSLSTNIFQLQNGVNETSQLIYGIPAGFLEIWSQIVAHGVTDPYIANAEANASLFQATRGFGGNAESIGYYTAFFDVWNSSFTSLPNSTSATQREQLSVNQASNALLQNPQVNNQTKQIVTSVTKGLNVTDWNEKSAISNLTISSIASNIPPSLSTSLGITPNDLVRGIYNLGPSPSNSTLGDYTISLFESSFSKNGTTTSSSGFSTSQLIQSSYDLGSSPSATAMKDLAAEFISNATESLFSGSPLFTVNATSLGSLIKSLPQNATSGEVQKAIDGVVSNVSYNDYPYVPARSITQNFVSKDNNTMIVIFNFNSSPDSKTIDQFKNDVQNSGLSSLGKTYVTGSAVVTQDVSNAFTPALTISIGPGIAVSLLIVGLLFFSPVAALIPVLLGGISIAIALPVIYFGIVILGRGTITFLTPTLTILLVLGLAVDYAVLQLRRTREERLKGKSTDESVGISVKWAGQAVLTAGITVVVAYIVMAVANVPLFSDVGTAIAMGVTVLLAVSLTLLPSLELALGDRIFWPGVTRHMKSQTTQKKSRLERLAAGTLKRKVAIASVISLVALGALYATVNTPTSADFLKLIPNFPSNQGLTVISNSMGSGTIAPATILLTTQSPIVTGNNQFNQTILNEIETISNAAANSSGVLTVNGPTRPYGSVFNYSSIQNMSAALKAQYLGGILSDIGKNNRTALITVGLSSTSESQAAVNSLLGMEKNVNKVSLSHGDSILYGGDTQSTYDSESFIDGLIPEVIIILAIAVYVILFAQLRSAFTPLRLIFTILCSVVFSLSLISLVFYHFLSLPILDFAPLFVIVTMLGVGIDYDIFFVTRIREEVLNGKSDNDAIITAVDRVWVTILGLGLVLSSVYGALLITGIAILQEIAMAVAGAILIDVLVVILFFVPSLMGLAQRANWWPSKIRRGQTEKKQEQVQKVAPQD